MQHSPCRHADPAADLLITADSHNLSYLVAQLANYGGPPLRLADSGWAEVREAQRRAVANDPK
jgi:hypothetical protein